MFRAPATSLSINTIGGLTAVRGGFDAGEHAFTISRLWHVEKIKTSTDEKTITAASISPLFGTNRADRLLGTSGNDVIDGLGGSDFIDGAGGTDTLILFGPKEKFDTQSITGITRIEGLDGAQEYAGYVIRIVNVETLNFTQSQSRSLSVDTAKRIFGSAGSDRLSGTLADEVFDGLGGSDTIDGGAGSDTLVLFGRYEDFSLIFPTSQSANLVVIGKESAARDYAGQILRTTDIEKIIFSGEVFIEINNPPSLMITPSSSLLAEGEAGNVLALTLSTQPLKPVQVTLETASQLSANIANLSFNPDNWSQPQIIIVTAVDDDVLERQHGASLSIRTVSEDIRYQSLTSTVSYTITDNDTQNLGDVSGKFWNDADIDGIFDTDERALVGWTVFDDLNRNGRLDAGELTAKTDSSGLYRLNDLAPGRHTISARSETGWSATFPSLQASSAAVLKNTAGSGEASLGTYYELPTLAEVSSTGNSSNLGVATNIGAFKSDPRFSDIQGQGLSVVVIDTGIDLNHPFFGPDTNGDGVADRIVYHYDYAGSNDASAGDFHGHGTHVAGIVASSDLTYPGIATAINIIVLKVFPDGNGGAAQGDLREALDWVVANVNRYNIVAVNLSLGGGPFDTSPRQGYLSTQFSALANAGVIVVSASGNGYDDHLDDDPKTTGSDKPGVAYPSSDPYSLSVGAVWAYDGGNLGTIQINAPIDAIAVFSQRDDTESDIFAPGAAITAAKNGGGAVAMSGTSMAAPEVTGMVALAQQLALRELGRRLSFEEIRELFKSTGKPIIDGDDENDLVTNTGLTFYRADMLKLAEAIVEMSPKISHTVDVKDRQTEENKNFGFAATSAIQTTSADDFIMGSLSGEVIRGGTGNDEMRGGEGDDEIYGEAGNDSLEGGTGDDLLDGGPGNDVATFNAPRSSFTVVFDALKNEYSITSTAEGIDRVTNVETFIFGSQTIAVENLIASQTDSTAPSVYSFSPADEATAVAIAANVAVTFSENIQRGAGSIVLKKADGTTVATYAQSSTEVTVSGSTLTINPASDLAYGTGYKVEFSPSSVQDLAGNNYAGTTSYNFTTVAAPDTTAPTVVTFSPTDGTTGVAIDANISLTFSEPVLAVKGGTIDLMTDYGYGHQMVERISVLDGDRIQVSGNVVTVDPSANLLPNTGYHLGFNQPFGDLAGNMFTYSHGAYNFNTAAPQGGGGQTNVTAKFWQDASKAPSESNKAGAVNLNDAISILKMIVGLSVNSNGAPLSPYQAVAADFDQSGSVDLTDAIGVLKMVVGLNAPAPTWKYFDDVKLAGSYNAAQALNHKAWSAGAVIDVSSTVDSMLKVIGVLTGDVDGSWLR